MDRIVVVGSGGAGKSTLARALAARLGLPHTELDSLYWRSGWQIAPTEEFRAQVDALTSGPHWVVCGNYSRSNLLTLARADTIIWLDYPLPLIWWRLLKRTVRRVLSRERLWGTDNRETWQKAFFSRDSILLYILQTHRRRSRQFAQLMQDDVYPNLVWLRFTSPRAAQHWLLTLPLNP